LLTLALKEQQRKLEAVEAGLAGELAKAFEAGQL
jgi:hypothetical protein